ALFRESASEITRQLLKTLLTKRALTLFPAHGWSPKAAIPRDRQSVTSSLSVAGRVGPSPAGDSRPTRSCSESLRHRSASLSAGLGEARPTRDRPVLPERVFDTTLSALPRLLRGIEKRDEA